jgi:hypothetical protein
VAKVRVARRALAKASSERQYSASSASIWQQPKPGQYGQTQPQPQKVLGKKHEQPLHGQHLVQHEQQHILHGQQRQPQSESQQEPIVTSPFLQHMQHASHMHSLNLHVKQSLSPWKQLPRQFVHGSQQ